MNSRLRAGKSSELIVCGELIRHGLDVYVPAVDDQAIDLVIRAEDENGVRYYDLQVKSVKGYARIIGVKSPIGQSGRYILIIHYKHQTKNDEFFYLTDEQIIAHHIKNSEWGDLIFKKAERKK